MTMIVVAGCSLNVSSVTIETQRYIHERECAWIRTALHSQLIISSQKAQTILPNALSSSHLSCIGLLVRNVSRSDIVLCIVKDMDYVV